MFEFETVSPESLGIPSKSIRKFVDLARLHSDELHSLQVLRHGKRCYYSVYAPYEKDMTHIMFSFSKSLTSTAIGFAEQEGLLSLDEKLIDIFPDKAPAEISDNLREADIRSLLTMTCGHAHEIQAHTDPDWIRTFLAHPFVYKPGTSYQYNTFGTNFLAAIIRKRTGLNVTEYLKPRLFDKIGIPAVECLTLADGCEQGGSGMYLDPESMGRFAQFILNKGSWEGEQLLNPGWYERAGSYQVSTISEVYTSSASEWRQGYGFQFWQCTPKNVFRADGAYGQFAVICPDQDAAIVISSVCSSTNTLLTTIYDTILADMQDEPLPEDPEALAQLRYAEKTAEIPAIWGIRSVDFEKKLDGTAFAAEADIPALAEIAGGNGKHFIDPGKLKGLAFSFREGSAVISVEQDNLSYQIEAPFNGHWQREDICGKPYAFAARWAGTRSLVVDVRHLHAALGSRLIFDFTEDSVSISTRSSYPIGPTWESNPAEGTFVLKKA